MWLEFAIFNFVDDIFVVHDICPSTLFDSIQHFRYLGISVNSGGLYSALVSVGILVNISKK